MTTERRLVARSLKALPESVSFSPDGDLVLRFAKYTVVIANLEEDHRDCWIYVERTKGHTPPKVEIEAINLVDKVGVACEKYCLPRDFHAPRYNQLWFS